MDKALNNYPKKASFKKAAAFASKHETQIEVEIAKSIYTKAVDANAKDAIELLSFSACK